MNCRGGEVGLRLRLRLQGQSGASADLPQPRADGCAEKRSQRSGAVHGRLRREKEVGRGGGVEGVESDERG